MKQKAKPDRGAQEIAGLICDALEALPKEEQKGRLKAIYDIKITDRRNSPKRVSTRLNSQECSRGEVLPRKRARR